jgi:hypothetical protein
MHVDDRPIDARVHQAIENVINQRLSGNGNKRLRARRRQGPHPLAFSGG